MLARSLLDPPAAAAGGTEYTYIRLVVTSWYSDPAGPWGILTQFEYSPDGGTTIYPNPKMTSDSAPSPQTASMTAGALNYAYFAFDGDASIYSAILFDFTGDGQITHFNSDGIAVNWARVTGIDTESGDAWPDAWAVYGSDTGDFTGEEELLLTFSGTPALVMTQDDS